MGMSATNIDFGPITRCDVTGCADVPIYFPDLKLHACTPLHHAHVALVTWAPFHLLHSLVFMCEVPSPSCSFYYHLPTLTCS